MTRAFKLGFMHKLAEAGFFEKKAGLTWKNKSTGEVMHTDSGRGIRGVTVGNRGMSDSAILNESLKRMRDAGVADAYWMTESQRKQWLRDDMAKLKQREAKKTWEINPETDLRAGASGRMNAEDAWYEDRWTETPGWKNDLIKEVDKGANPDTLVPGATYDRGSLARSDAASRRALRAAYDPGSGAVQAVQRRAKVMAMEPPKELTRAEVVKNRYAAQSQQSGAADRRQAVSSWWKGLTPEEQSQVIASDKALATKADNYYKSSVEQAKALHASRMKSLRPDDPNYAQKKQYADTELANATRAMSPEEKARTFLKNNPMEKQVGVVGRWYDRRDSYGFGNSQQQPPTATAQTGTTYPAATQTPVTGTATAQRQATNPATAQTASTQPKAVAQQTYPSTVTTQQTAPAVPRVSTAQSTTTAEQPPAAQAATAASTGPRYKFNKKTGVFSRKDGSTAPWTDAEKQKLTSWHAKRYGEGGPTINWG